MTEPDSKVNWFWTNKSNQSTVFITMKTSKTLKLYLVEAQGQLGQH